MTGLLLGDLCIHRQKTAVNVRLQFCQGIVHKDYLLHLYDLFEIYCNTGPKTTNRSPDIRTGKTYNTIGFQTLALPCFKELYDLFYSSGVKTVPVNFKELLTPLALAYWIGDDGGFCKTSQRLTLATHSFTLKDIELLSEILDEKFNLKCAVHKNNKSHVIRVPAKSLSVLQELLASHMPTTMRHKIGLS
uniref:LAGLIDADG homing endonuclease n=1 Tax=Rhizoctonia solani TaxID=456999 RepID=A0A8E8L7S6_9AGAM|nr:LAGLIDADG homing endonuclease [Rhizoctonia solani]